MFVALLPWFALTVALYAPFLSHPFQYDDAHTIVANAALHQPDAWRDALTGALRSSGEIQGGHYRPLTHLSYWLTIRLVGLTPAGFHAVNLGLHLMAAWLLMILIRDLTADRRAAVLAAVLFALHPAVSEAVLYASARATLLSSLFMLAALVCYVRARQRIPPAPPLPPTIRTGWWWAGWAGFGLAALLSKESAVALPLLCVAADRLLDDRGARNADWSRWGPHLAAFGALVGFLVWLGLWRSAASAWAEPDAVARYLDVVARQTAAIGLAIRLFLAPWPLTVDHLLPAWPDPAALGLMALAGACAATGVIGLASRTPAARRAGFFALWVVIVALPTTLWPLNVPFQEHRAYLQHAGLAALAALGLVRLADAGALTKRTGTALALVVAAAWAWLIVDQGRAWRDPVRLWERARLASPASFRAHANAGLALAAADRWTEAESALSAALALNPDYVPALTARGVTVQRAGRRDAARVDYERAARLRPDYVPVLYNLGLIAHESNDPAGAEQWYRRALAVNPLHHDSLLNLSALLISQQRLDEADARLAAARRASPRSPEALYYSGVVAERLGRADEARAHFEAAATEARAVGKTALADDAAARLTALQAMRRPS
ncbi:MAG: tetratricopeptide repeat protein [Nitrospirota bacterium]